MNRGGVIMKIWINAIVRVVVAAIIFGLISCSDNEISKEDEIRAWLDKGELLAEARKIGSLVDLVSDDYTDDNGRVKKDIHRALFVYINRNRSIHLFHRVKKITFIEPDSAEVKIVVAMTGQPVKDGDDLRALKADMYSFDFILTKDDDWELTAAKWNRVADITEFW